MRQISLFKQLMGVVFLGLIVVLGGQLVGCSAASSDAGKDEAANEKPDTKPVNAAAKAPLPKQIQKARDFTALYALQKEYEAGGKKDRAVQRALAERWAAITQNMKPSPLVDGLDFLAVDTRVTAPNEYTFSFLLRPVAALTTDYHLKVFGLVFPQNMDRLPGGGDNARHPTWTQDVTNPPTSAWRTGTYQVVQMKVNTALVPYNLVLSLRAQTGAGEMYTEAGNRLLLGWQWAYANEDAFIAKVEACESFADLYALAPPGPKVSGAVAKAIEKQWKKFAAGMKPRPMVKGLHILGVDTEATGENEYTFSFLFKATQDITQDYHLSIRAEVDESHIRHIEPAAPGAAHVKWSVLLYRDPTSLWRAGEYHVVQRTVKTPLIPYNLLVILQNRDEEGKVVGNPGNQVRLGWQADLPEERPQPENKQPEAGQPEAAATPDA
ncbi:MAG: hypothetical protein ACLFTT_10310 [Candidatus Hydrogenedentota bacterium]